MNIFRRARSRSPSWEVPKLCLSRQKRTISVDSQEGQVHPVETVSVKAKSSPPTPIKSQSKSSSRSSRSKGSRNKDLKEKDKDSLKGSLTRGKEGKGSLTKGNKDSIKEKEKADIKSPKQAHKQVKQPVLSVPSLEVPDIGIRGRSSSFDTSSLDHEKEVDEENMLRIPEANRRSRSFDASYSGGSTSDDGASDNERPSMSFLSIPKYYRRRSLEIPKICIHCVHIEALAEAESSQKTSPSTFIGGHNKFELDKSVIDNDYWTSDSGSEEDETDDESCGSSGGGERYVPITLSVTPTDSEEAIIISSTMVEGRKPTYAMNNTLEVPLVKQRSSSMDAAYLQPGIMDDRRASLDVDMMLDVPKQPRSSSVEVSLPTPDEAHYKAIRSPSTASER